MDITSKVSVLTDICEALASGNMAGQQGICTYLFVDQRDVIGL